MSQFDEREERGERTERVQRRHIKGPDVAERNAQLEKLNAEIKAKDTAIAELSAQLSKLTTAGGVQEERKQLIAELTKLRKVQGEFKDKRNLVNAKVKEIDASLKRKVGEIQATTAKHSFKSVQDIDAKIAFYNEAIASGELKLVDERRYIKEISNLHKLRKDFDGLVAIQNSIDADKAKIAALKAELAGLNSKEVNAKYDEIQKKLDGLNDANKSVNDKRQAVYSKRQALYKEKDALYASIKKIRADYDEKFKNFQKALKEEKQRVIDEEARLKAEKDKAERSTKIQQILDDAKRPAFEREIDSIYTLLQVFDPTFVKPVKTTNAGSVKKTFITRTGGRVIEQIPDDLIIKKEETPFFQGSTKSKKKSSSGPASKKFTLEPDVITALGELDIALPMTAEDVPKTVEALNAKLDEFKSTEAAVTEKNIESANKKIAKLQAEWEKMDAK